MSRKGPYEILGVTLTASTEEIKDAYRNLVKRYHPDLYRTYIQKVWATNKMQEINHAYAILRDAQFRKEYDKSQAAREPVPAGRRADAEQTSRAQSTRAQPDVPERDWFQWFLCGTWLTVSTILFSFVKPYFDDSLLGYMVAVVISCWLGVVATGAISLVPILAWEQMEEFDEKLSAAPSHPWRDLGVRLALLATVVVLVLRFGYPPDTKSFLSYFFLGFGLMAILTLLGVSVALVLYIYRGKKVAETTKVLLAG